MQKLAVVLSIIIIFIAGFMVGYVLSSYKLVYSISIVDKNETLSERMKRLRANDSIDFKELAKRLNQ